MRLRPVRLVVFLGLLAPAAHAEGQISFSTAIDSDDRFRGMSLSHGRPDVRLDVAYDHGNGRGGGLYAGASLAAAPGRAQRNPLIHYTAFAGWVSPPRSGVSWEGGVTHTRIDDRERYDYDEVYAGLFTPGISLRVSYSPRYYGHDVQTLYADVSGGRQLSPRLRIFAHAGWLTRVSGDWRLRGRHDLSAGVATTLGPCELRLAITQAPSLYAWGRDDGAAALVASATRAF